MNNLTRLKILKPINEVFEAFVDPEKIGNFWFSSNSDRLETGRTITLRYDEYNAQIDIKILEVELNKKIVFNWDANGDGHVVTISLKELDQSTTRIEVNEEGFDENDPEFINQLLDNKEGWVFMLTCLKGYLENGINNIRAGLVKE